ncbi:peptidoglycan-binding protein [Streptomyces gramineus]|uniref:peptidoglycan-binding protein n=1 Tax=Streptomyces gramineus TaxID=910542 RepID=UPI00398AFA8A
MAGVNAFVESDAAANARDTAVSGSVVLPDSAQVTKGDLDATLRLDGTLGFTPGRNVNAGGKGVLTWLPRGGARVGRGGKVYELNGRPAYLMYGRKPMYRQLEEGAKGEDVRQLKQNLIALGFGSGLSADDEFTSGTARAVRHWQKSHGQTQTGEVGPDQMVFAPGALRVQKAVAGLGDGLVPGAPVLKTTGSSRRAEFDLKVSDADRVREGDRAVVVMPDGSRRKGGIASIGTVAEKSSGSDQSGDTATARVPATIEFDKPDDVRGLDQTPVDVLVPGESRKNVLSVPVEALLALPSGGFGVQALVDGRVRQIKVRLGLFAEGRVEVSGAGLRAGMKVGVAQ